MSFLPALPNTALALTVAALLAACGGGGGDDDSPGPLPAVPDGLALAPTTACSMAGIGATRLSADAPVTILDVSEGNTGSGPRDRGYCLVKLKVDAAVNIWVALPSSDWNGRFRAEGNGVYAGDSQLGVAADSVRQGFVGARTDTGHTGFFLSGAFGMLEPGRPNTPAQIDFAYRSQHLMAVVGKQLAHAFTAAIRCARTGTAAPRADARAWRWRSAIRPITTPSSPVRRRSTGTASKPIRSGRRW